ncbi:MAG: hypothetical protein U1E65_19700 [Myxococcota bacterium]
MSHPIAAQAVELLVSNAAGALELPPAGAETLRAALKRLSDRDELGFAVLALINLAERANAGGATAVADALVAVASTAAGALGLQNAAFFNAKLQGSRRVAQLIGQRPLSLARPTRPLGKPAYTIEPLVALPRRA